VRSIVTRYINLSMQRANPRQFFATASRNCVISDFSYHSYVTFYVERDDIACRRREHVVIVVHKRLMLNASNGSLIIYTINIDNNKM
jgi:hypothetical protein